MDPVARARLSAAIAGRREHLRLPWKEVARLAGLTKEGLRSVRNETRKMMPLTKRGIEDALQWAPGSIDLILNNEAPVELDESATPAAVAQAGAGRPSVQRWFVAELERRDLSLDDVKALLNGLRVIADHNAQTLGELLVEAGLVNGDELELRDQHSPVRTAIAEFRREVDGITASPHLSARQRRQIEDEAARELDRIRAENSGDA